MLHFGYVCLKSGKVNNRRNTKYCTIIRSEKWAPMATVQIRKEEVGEVKDVEALFGKLSEKYAGQWVAILSNGKIVANEKLESLYDQVNAKEFAVLLQIPKKDELLLL